MIVPIREEEKPEVNLTGGPAAKTGATVAAQEVVGTFQQPEHPGQRIEVPPHRFLNLAA